MPEEPYRRRLDAPTLLYEAGRQAQAVALVMRKHEIVPTLGVCKACGRIPNVVLPMFGDRCDVAAEQWRLARHTLRRLLDSRDRHEPRLDDEGGKGHFTGRARVPPSQD